MTEPAANPSSDTPAVTRRQRRLRRLLRVGIDVGAVAMLIAAVAGFCLRDRWPPLAVLTYFPLAHVAMGALAWDLARRGRVLGRARFALSAVSLVFVVIGVVWMSATEPLDPILPHDGPPVRLAHWNVKWAGAFRQQGEQWDAIDDELGRHRPDVIVLAEAPKQIAGDASDWKFDDGWSTARWYGMYRNKGYYWSVVIASRWPVTERWREYVKDGVAICVEIDSPTGTLRLLVVDGLSDPRRDRVPFLDAIADLAERSADRGQPVDVIVGDFNAVSRSIGFDRYEADPLHFKLAARHGSGWRATGPAILPMIDVDHAWLGPGVRVQGVQRFTRWPSDHVGYLLEIQP